MLKKISKLKGIGLYTLTIAISSLLFSCCKDKKCEPIIRYENELKDFEKAFIPYSGNETLYFVNSKTKDTLIFIGSGKQSDHGEKIITQDVKCPVTRMLERERIIFYSINSPDPITVSLLYYSVTSNTYLEVNWKNKIANIALVSFGPPFSHDTISVLNAHYKKVSYFMNDYQPQLNDGFGCYYTLDSTNAYRGILRIETKNDGTLDLLKID